MQIASQAQKVDNAEKKPKLKKIKQLYPKQVINKVRKIYEFDGQFLASFGKPEYHSKWFITGPPYSGKSSFVFMLCNYLIQFGKVDYNNHEEAGGDADTVAEKLKDLNLNESKELRFFKAQIESDEYETFSDRLAKRNSAPIAVLDSLQHAQMDKRQFIEFTDRFSNSKKAKMLIFISHWIKNDFVKFVKHDFDIKIEIISFVAHVLSRCREAKNIPFIIWEEGAKKYWGKNYKKVIDGKYWPGIKR